MLDNPATNAALNAQFDGLGIASNGTDVVLLVSSSNAKQLYAIDIADNNPADAANNTITAIPNVNALLSGATGFAANNLTIRDMETNPISKSVYLLVTSGSQAALVRIKDNGATVDVLNTTSMTYAAMDWGTPGFEFNDMTYGNDTLYVTSGSWTLDGAIGSFAMPFVHNSSASLRSTTMFKTNWGGGYFTDAPLERLDFANINGKNRIMGVTVCAPGFSVETSSINGSGLLQVTEDFNIRFAPPTKVVHQNQNGTHYLFNLHQSFGGGPVFMRIGESFIDGSQVANNQHNNNAVHLRTTSGARTPGLTDNEFLLYSNTFNMIAFHDNYNLLVLENDSLKLFATGSNVTTSTSLSNTNAEIQWFPNPASNEIIVDLHTMPATAPILSISTVDGKIIKQQILNKTNSIIDVKNLPNGQYFISIESDGKPVFSDILTKQ